MHDGVSWDYHPFRLCERAMPEKFRCRVRTLRRDRSVLSGTWEWFEGGKCLALMRVGCFQAPWFITVIWNTEFVLWILFPLFKHVNTVTAYYLTPPHPNLTVLRCPRGFRFWFINRPGDALKYELPMWICSQQANNCVGFLCCDTNSWIISFNVNSFLLTFLSDENHILTHFVGSFPLIYNLPSSSCWLYL